jgi:hypothetical protein
MSSCGCWYYAFINCSSWVSPGGGAIKGYVETLGLGTVIKAAASGELAGVGRLGVSGKTTCDWSHPEDDEKTRRNKRCSNHGHCILPLALQTLVEEYRKPFPERDYARIAATAESVTASEPPAVDELGATEGSGG